MNAGAYKDNLANHLIDVCVLKNNTICWMKKDELDYAYRHSIFQSHKDWTILVGRFQLEKGNQNDIRDLMDSRRERRMSARLWINLVQVVCLEIQKKFQLGN